ncbi:hypothetical protein Tsubulata_070016 [Turnera subulata]|nr:hypothetical protein Tsubulata_070016 [Turnera subulata]
MATESTGASSQPPAKPPSAANGRGGQPHPAPPAPAASPAPNRSSNLPQPTPPGEAGAGSGNVGMSTFARLTSGLGLRFPSVSEETGKEQGNAASSQAGAVFESLTKGLVDSSKSAVKVLQLRARHAVSQNKRRYQEGDFDLDMAYITENVIAMGFPAGDLSSGIFGFFEGLYRNHMEEVIRFFETHHKDKYKVYNLCSERLYDASRFEGKVACFPFDDHNCPPLQLITLFCRSAYSWLKEDIQNVVVVHCKAGMGRTGLMICSLLLFLKFFPTSDEAIDYFNKKRCVDGKALVLPSQIRYVKYFERILTYFNGENQPGRRCMLRGFRVQKCPFWLRPSITISNHSGVLFSTRNHPKTKDLMPEDFWISSSKKGVLIFALPGEPGITELVGDFKIHFHDRQGDFYCWLNTTMIENRKTLDASDLDGFDKRKLPSPGFQVEIVMIDYDGTLPTKSNAHNTRKESDGTTSSNNLPVSSGVTVPKENRQVADNEDDVFSDSDGEETGGSKGKQSQGPSAVVSRPDHASNMTTEQMKSLAHGAEQLSLHDSSKVNASKKPGNDSVQSPASGLTHTIEVTDIKAIAADASVFSFGDEEDYESE